MKFLFLSLTLAGCASVKKGPENFVLVHDSHFDERSLAALDRYLGEDSQVVELPTSTKLGNSEEYFKNIKLSNYAQAVCETVERTKGSVALVAHGFGGAVVNEAYGLCPERVVAIVYIGSPIPFPGELPYELGTDQDKEFYRRAINPDDESGLFQIADWYNFVETYASDGSAEQREYIKKIAKDEPMAPLESTLSFDRDKYQKLKKLVIVLNDDKVISPETQKRYTLRLENATIKEFSGNHLAPILNTEIIGQLIIEFHKQP